MAAAAHLLLSLKPKPKPIQSRTPLPSRRACVPFPRSRLPPLVISAAASDLISPVASDLLAPAPSLKARLAAGDTLYGLFLLSFSPTLAELAAFAGYDYVVVDMEHGPGGILEALACLRAHPRRAPPPRGQRRLGQEGARPRPRGPHAPRRRVPRRRSGGRLLLLLSAARRPWRRAHRRPCFRLRARRLLRLAVRGRDPHHLPGRDRRRHRGGRRHRRRRRRRRRADGPAGSVSHHGVPVGPREQEGAGDAEAERKVLEARKKKVAGSDGNAAYLGGFAMPNDPAEQLKLRGYHMVAGAVDVGLFRKAALDDIKRFREAGSDGDWRGGRRGG